MSETLEHEADLYGGIIVTADSLPEDVGVFKKRLENSLVAWKGDSKRGVWLKIPTTKSQLVHTAIRAGFDFHHAKQGYVMLITWLPGPDVPNSLPDYANHSIGVGGYVEAGDGRLLFIKEAKGHYKDWKLPGGAVDPGETLAEAVEREVFEETGIKCQFIEVISFTHHHGFRFGASDIYFVARCRAVTMDINIDPVEIGEAAWLTPEDAMASPGAQKNEHNHKIIATAKFLQQHLSDTIMVPTHIMKQRRPYARAMYYRLQPASEPHDGITNGDKKEESTEPEGEPAKGDQFS